VGLNLLTFWGVGLPLCSFLGSRAGDQGLGFGMVAVIPVTLALSLSLQCSLFMHPRENFRSVMAPKVTMTDEERASLGHGLPRAASSCSASRFQAVVVQSVVSCGVLIGV